MMVCDVVWVEEDFSDCRVDGMHMRKFCFERTDVRRYLGTA